MRIFIRVILALLSAVPAGASVRSGHAEVSWSAASSTYQPGTPLRTALRLKADAGWHTYWDNPGEGGMPTGIRLRLPDGWTAGVVGKPVPVRFRTGGLPGFGYEGEVWFPVEITPPAGAAGNVVLEAEVEWLACSDDACVPGDARVKLALSAGEPTPTADAERIARAAERVPVPAADVSLDIAAAGGAWLLTIRSSRAGLDPAACEVFPLTPRVVDAAAEIRFVPAGAGMWTAGVPRSEYAEETPGPLQLVLAPAGGGRPLLVSTAR